MSMSRINNSIDRYIYYILYYIVLLGSLFYKLFNFSYNKYIITHNSIVDSEIKFKPILAL